MATSRTPDPIPELSTLIEAISSPLLLLDQESHIVAANTAAAILLGSTSEEINGKLWAGVDAQLTLINWKMHWQGLLKQQTLAYTTDVMTDGRFLRPVSVKLSLFRPSLVLAELTDQIQENAAQAQMKALEKTTGTGSFFYDRVAGKLWISDTAKALIEYTSEPEKKALAAYLQSISTSGDWDNGLAQFQQALEEQSDFYVSFSPANIKEQGNLIIEGRSIGNTLHVTHLYGSIRKEVKTTYAVAGDITEELARFSIDEALEMIFWTRPDGTISYVNQAAAKKLGYSQEQLKNASVEVIAPYFNEAYRQAFWDQLRSDKTFSAEYDVFTNQGSAVPIGAEVNYLKIGEEEYACSFCRDLSVFRKRNALIELSQSALDFTTDSVVWLEEDFSIRYVNQRTADLIGGSTESWLGKTYQSIYPLLSESTITEGKTEDLKITDKSGQQMDIELRCDVVNLKGGHFFVLVGRDITARKERELNLKRAYEEIRDLKEKIEEENLTLRDEVNTNYNINNIITVSPKYRKTLQQINQVAEVDTTVLITGETGTGKELLARAIHKISDRESRPLIKVNCAALPESLIESELFGHEKGAFTGATGRKKGRFELADGGSLFLDEVGEMPLELQAKLLRVLQEGEFERLGGTETINVDVRLIAATNRNLEEMVNEGRFRSDLYYRLNVFPINNLPLRERPADIPVLVEHFAKKFAREQGKKIDEISSSDLAKLGEYDFPGNIRELENIIERAVVLCNNAVLRIPFTWKKSRSTRRKEEEILPFEAMQRQHIIRALKATGGRITGPEGAGVLLEMNDRTLMSKMRKLNIQKREYLV